MCSYYIPSAAAWRVVRFHIRRVIVILSLLLLLQPIVPIVVVVVIDTYAHDKPCSWCPTGPTRFRISSDARLIIITSRISTRFRVVTEWSRVFIIIIIYYYIYYIVFGHCHLNAADAQLSPPPPPRKQTPTILWFGRRVNIQIIIIIVLCDRPRYACMRVSFPRPTAEDASLAYFFSIPTIFVSNNNRVRVQPHCVRIKMYMILYEIIFTQTCSTRRIKKPSPSSSRI